MKFRSASTVRLGVAKWQTTAPTAALLLLVLVATYYLLGHDAVNSRNPQSYAISIDVSDATLSQLCSSAIGTWCVKWVTRKREIPWTSPPRGTKDCLWECNHRVGVCNAIAGWCRCPAGWTGDSCEHRMRRPCSQYYRKHGFEPYDQPNDWQRGGLTLRCGGECDDDIGMCFCNSSAPYGRVPAGPDEAPGHPPRRVGRPMGHLCQPNFEPATNALAHFGDKTFDELYGHTGWCYADKPAHTCPCRLDGMLGELCDIPAEHFCLNQCSGHGDCYLGWCRCHKGFFGQDCAFRLPGVDWEAGRYGTPHNRPWVGEHARTPAAEDPPAGATRARPLIYVYELPPIHNQLMLMFRFDRKSCVHRVYGQGNVTSFQDGWLYGSETALHEMILQSKHRTLNPEKADFFYIPMYIACMFWPVSGAADFPFFHGGPAGGHRPAQATNMMIEAWSWLRSRHPWWDRSGGRDHIVLASHDKASCYVPEVLRNATIISHWGRLDFPHSSFTGYGDHEYSLEVVHKLYQPEGHLSKLGNYSCFDPKKYSRSPLYGAPEESRTVFAFFKGNMRRNDKTNKYSRGIRQALARLCMEHDWWGKYRIWINDTMPPGAEESFSYSEALSKSVFCFALPGDGWSARFEDAILHGCIPVIIQDDVQLAFESLLNFTEFSLRISQKNVDKVPEILTAVPESQRLALQAGVRRVWRRYQYSTYIPYAKKAAEIRDKWRRDNASTEGGETTDSDVMQHDAFETFLAFLNDKLDG